MTPISSKRIAVFPGTFDPFTLGHMSIVSRGLELLDEVVIAIGINDSKRTYFTVEQRLEMLPHHRPCEAMECPVYSAGYPVGE